MNRTARRLAAALLLTALAAAGLRAADRPKFSLAVLRRDGVMIPFASFDGRAWGVQWPSSDSDVPLPISRNDIPKKWWGPQGPDVPWRATLPGGETRPLALGQPVHAKVFCSGHPAVGTDYRGSAVDPREPTVPKDGLAVSGDVKVDDIISVSVNAPDAKHLIGLITEEFNKEEALAATQFMAWRHPYSVTARAEFPIQLEAFYRTIDTTSRGTWKTSYIEAIRRFPARPGDEGCGLITFVRGWVTEQDGKAPVINLGARVTYCDRAEVSFMLPLGRIVTDNDVHWVYQISSWRDEVYTVSRVRATEVRPVIAVPGGGCPRDLPFGRGRRGE
jgi:hypothetical protein